VSADGPVYSAPASSQTVTILAPAALTASLAVSVTEACGAAPFLVVLTVSDTGDVGANVTVPDPAQSGGGTAVKAAGPAFPVLLPGHTAMIFTWTYTGATPGTVFFTATPSGTEAGTGAPLNPGPVTSGPVQLYSDLVTLTISQTRSPASPVPGGPFSFKLIVTNTSPSATITDLLVVDTAPGNNQVNFTNETHSAGLSFVSGGGGAVSWTSTGLALGPNMSVTITGDGTVSQCYTGVVFSQGSAYGRAHCGAASVVAPADTWPLTAPVLSFTVSKTQTPASPGVGGFVTYRIVVTNTGQATISDLYVTDTVSK
jgi:uncharacterized repeat protein (TIGR01451 family)